MTTQAGDNTKNWSQLVSLASTLENYAPAFLNASSRRSAARLAKSIRAQLKARPAKRKRQ
jgi:hypothetical protein